MHRRRWRADVVEKQPRLRLDNALLRNGVTDAVGEFLAVGPQAIEVGFGEVLHARHRKGCPSAIGAECEGFGELYKHLSESSYRLWVFRA